MSHSWVRVVALTFICIVFQCSSKSPYKSFWIVPPQDVGIVTLYNKYFCRNMHVIHALDYQPTSAVTLC